MRRYIALLRGVNISGKNKVPMAELKLGFESLGFSDVRTWLNSGNVVFSSEETEAAALTGQIEGMIQRRFGLVGNGGSGGLRQPHFHSAARFFSGRLSRDRRTKGGPGADPGLRAAVFWSFDRKKYQKTNWWPKTASAEGAPKLTIRTANAVRKIARL